MELRTTKEIIEFLGGLDEVAKLTGRNKDAAWNWLHRFDTFPANTFVAITSALEAKGCSAPPSLWKMVEPVGQE